MLSGIPYHQAKQFYQTSDGINVKRVLNHSLQAHIQLEYHDSIYHFSK